PSKRPNNYLYLVIISFLFFWPLSISALYNSIKVNKYWEQNLIEQSKKASKRTVQLAISAIILSLVIGVIIIFSIILFSNVSYK
ncbi:MAG: CD225/dispanin family protein, partial [Flavobacteriaceae bacterium]|nr:CD225/dispanin family protein [Candidatus Onthonaster equi]